MHVALLVLLAAGLAACSAAPADTADGSAGGLALTTDADTYGPGATAQITFRNGTDAGVALAQPLSCAVVEREDAGGWSPVPSGRGCAAVLVPVGPGATESATVAVPTEAGTYRVVQAVYPDEGDGATVASAPFAVR